MDIYAIVTMNQALTDDIVIPNPHQYESVKYIEKEIRHNHIYLCVRSRVDAEAIYEDHNKLVALCGSVYDGAQMVTPRHFVELYTEHGRDALKRFKGIYSFVIVDKKSLRVTVINDLFGLIPVFYYSDDESVVLSTKLDFVKSNSKESSNDIDYLAILEQIYLNYTIGDKTYYKNIRMHNAASILEFDFTHGTIQKKETIYWHLSEIIGKIELPDNKAMRCYSNTFHAAVNSSVRNYQRPIQALTAGYDSRTILAALHGNGHEVPCFSYGTKESLDITIPSMMQKRFGFNYTPLYLADDFREHFVDYATNAIFHSDGLGDLEKANNEYAYRLISNRYSDVIVGIFGSEFIKSHKFPNRLIPDYILECFPFFKNNGSTLNPFGFNDSYLDDCVKNISKYIEAEYLNKYRHLSDSHRFFLFYYYEAVRKYFMKEMRIGRYYVNVVAPFIDRDLLEILFRSRLTNVYNFSVTGNGLLQRQKTHFLYSYMMKQYMPALLDIKTSKGYRPKYDLNPLSRLLILPYYVRQKMKKQRPQYFYDTWAKPFMKKFVNVLKESDELRPLFRNNQVDVNINDHEKLHRLVSVAVYLHGLSS